MCWNNELLVEHCTFAILILQICILRLKYVFKRFILVIIIHLLTFFFLLNLFVLQLKLLNNGFRLLNFRDHFSIFLFYDFFLSVSLTDSQNEYVVKQFLKENAAGRVFVHWNVIYIKFLRCISVTDVWNIWKFIKSLVQLYYKLQSLFKTLRCLFIGNHKVLCFPQWWFWLMQSLSFFS